jgi:hypothetical protein
MLNTAATRVPSTLAERFATAITWLRTRANAPVTAGSGAVTPIWELEARDTYRMTACGTCGEIVNPASRLCRYCGNAAR